MTADVEVSRSLLNSECAFELAAILVLECVLCHVILLIDVVFLEEFEVGGVEEIAIGVESPFLNGTDVGMVSEHDVLNVEGNDLAWESGETDVEIDSILISKNTSFPSL